MFRKIIFHVRPSFKLSAVLVPVLMLAGCAARPVVDNPWARVRATAPLSSGLEPRAIGSYTAGCVVGAMALPAQGKGYQVMRLLRERFYGHPALVRYLERMGAQVDARELGVLLIGDLGQPRGGPTMSNHRSHQNGLDVDIWFALSAGDRETMAAESVVSADGKTLKPELWKKQYEGILALAAGDPAVERIFVNAAIKKALCAKSAAWLHKLRPWWGHDDHFHVRLACIGPECKAQEPVPAGSGCDSSLDWWFGDEAKARNAEAGAPAKLPELPAACADVLKM